MSQMCNIFAAQAILYQFEMCLHAGDSDASSACSEPGGKSWLRLYGVSVIIMETYLAFMAMFICENKSVWKMLLLI